jgi:hypothetical protein
MNKVTDKNHNLNIQSYSLEEIFGLFDLTHDISSEDLLRAKKKVLMLHPDKSKLPAEYFLFYKKAFDIVVGIYNHQNKQNQVVKNVEYAPPTDKSVTKTITSKMKEMSAEEFQGKFNKLFDENMAKKPDPHKNEWFQNDEPAYQIEQNVNASNMGRAIEHVKKQSQNNALTNYRGVQTLYSSGNGTNVYDDDDDSGSYVTSDPFGKLKFDDLRKVHKDQTVFAVSERDFENVQQYSSVDHFVRERSRIPLDPMEKQKAEQMLASREKQMQEQMIQRGYLANLQTMKYEEKNKTVLSAFMMLENGKSK